MAHQKWTRTGSLSACILLVLVVLERGKTTEEQKMSTKTGNRTRDLSRVKAAS